MAGKRQTTTGRHMARWADIQTDRWIDRQTYGEPDGDGRDDELAIVDEGSVPALAVSLGPITPLDRLFNADSRASCPWGGKYHFSGLVPARRGVDSRGPGE
ncbi:hypothetical protein MGYG_04374 [Nannizzia gypsea CBS 118893]|uniref:Uncharacterized protein n=1 Tax=Arthroderma gypseum (strain ATCC MYA-4604 / CBS 118893) TaxID=535722 RepID=E4USL6_ARTGP|nr:hypothetical protein MGYG_04374 [Nannizzia gypsea CBS 118893]EFR01367.1 hypothetical protein MGYG_04374 [Nannizzia gypsea CBS 118893]